MQDQQDQNDQHDIQLSPPASPRAAAITVNAFESRDTPIRPGRAHKRSATGFVPPDNVPLSEVFPPSAETVAWKTAIKRNVDAIQTDPDTISAAIVRHAVTTLARAPFNVDELAIYQATALSVRDRLIAKWNSTQIFQTQSKVKRVYYFSLEFLLGRSLDNALLNLEVKDQYSQSIKSLGFRMEDLLDAERDAGLGNGGLGRLSACYMDSMSTVGIPAWGYGLRYQYGIFRQILDSSGAQVEVPDPWLDHSNPWEIPRLDAGVEVKFYGDATRGGLDGKGPGNWTGGQDVLAIPYDMPIPGAKIENTNTIRLWSSRPKKAFDLAAFNAGDYEKSVKEAEQAENISRVLYPNDNMIAGKILRLKQQYLWVAASLSDIIRRFKKLNLPWTFFPEYNAIQLNDTHPAIAIVELQRILVDEENQEWDLAWGIVRKTFSYTNHTVLPEALEKWPVDVFSALLPRHMQLIFDINLFFLQDVEKRFTDRAKIQRMSLIEEGSPQFVRMAYLAIIGSHKVNGVAELHSGLIKEMFHDFVDYFGPDHFTNVTNGITPRRWLNQCNPELSALITSKLNGDAWLLDMKLLQGFAKFADDPDVQKAFRSIKFDNKKRLAKWIERNCGIPINEHALFDVMCKRLHEYKRQFMAALGIIYRYLQLKKMTPAQRKLVVPRVSIFAGKAAPGYYIAKLVILLISSISKKIAADPDMDSILQVAFLPDYSVSLAEIIIPASDISEHISTAGTEASGTSNMKFCLNGGLLLGTQDGANIEIAEEVGSENVFFFGNLTADVPNLRRAHVFGESVYPAELLETVDAIRSGTFGDASVFEPLLATLFEGKDFYLVSDDFLSYLEAQRMVDEAYVDKADWTARTIRTVANMGKFSSDRAILQYADEIWNIEASKVPDTELSDLLIYLENYLGPRF